MYLQPVIVAVGLIRRADEVLLVEQQGPEDKRPAWVLPGGVAAPGELLVDTVRREVLEETGLRVLEVGSLLYTVQMDNAQEGSAVLAFCLSVPAWEGEIRPADPDNLILQARFWPLSDALRLLDAVPYAYISHPGAAHLRGEAGSGTSWLFRRNRAGRDELIARLPGATRE